jgi:hypothetical protein
VSGQREIETDEEAGGESGKTICIHQVVQCDADGPDVGTAARGKPHAKGGGVSAVEGGFRRYADKPLAQSGAVPGGGEHREKKQGKEKTI